METTHRLNYLRDATSMMYEDSISIPITQNPHEHADTATRRDCIIGSTFC